jgi:hypothetical protein
MRRPPDGAWDLAICLGNSLSLLASEDDLREAFEAVFERLADEGVFLFQTLNYERAQAREARHRVERRPLDAGELVAVKSLVPHGNRTLLTLNFFADGESGVDTVSDAAVLRNWTRDELVATGEAAGFGVEGVWGGVDMRGYEAGESPDVIALLRKK